MKELNVGDSAPDLPDMDEKKEFSALDVPIIGISPDPPQSHRKFIGKQDLKVHLLSDISHMMFGKYGVRRRKKLYGKEYSGEALS
jgi:peroxiredoxin Q/BCP